VTRVLIDEVMARSAFAGRLVDILRGETAS
jgi:hypothetical protein